MNFLIPSIAGYALTGGAILIDKILLNKSLPSPLVYVFYTSILGLLAILLFPFGVVLTSYSIVLSSLAGIFFSIGLIAFFESLRLGEASIVGPVIGALNPLFTLILGSLIFNQFLSFNHIIAFFIILIGTLILTLSLIAKNIALNKQLMYMVLAGLLFAISYLLQKEGYTVSNFLSGLVISRLGAGAFVLSFLISKNFRKQIFIKKPSSNHNFSIKKTSILLLLGQFMGALSAIFIGWAVSVGNPALVNSLFGVQYLVIMLAAIFFKSRHSNLLGETITLGILFQKVIGALILSYGVYLLSV
jgi:drug/metabolite transporter (DMT)-like permease